MTPPSTPRPTRIVDVARVAGVSPQTVSNVVNDRGGFADATRRRVLAAIAQTGYRPNRAARQLRTQRTRHIGFPLQGRSLDLRNPFTLSFLKAVSRAARPAAHRVVVFTYEEGDVETLESWALGGEVDGFVFCDVMADDLRTRILTAHGIPFWVFGRTHPSEPQTWVDIDNRGAIERLVDYLVATGHRRIGYVGHAGTEHWTVARLEGARDRLRHHGLELAPEATVLGQYETVQPAVDDLLSSEQGLTAILTDSDSMAVRTSAQARARGLRIGTDLAVTGFGGGLLESLIEPPLTTVRMPLNRIATEVVTGLLRTLDGTPAPAHGVVVPTELVVGGSA